MTTWPALLERLNQVQKLAKKQKGDKRKQLEAQIAKLQAQIRQVSSRELGHHQYKSDK